MHHDPISLLSQLRGLMVCIRTSCIREMPDFSPTNLSILKVYHCLRICHRLGGFCSGTRSLCKGQALGVKIYEFSKYLLREHTVCQTALGAYCSSKNYKNMNTNDILCNLLIQFPTDGHFCYFQFFST